MAVSGFVPIPVEVRFTPSEIIAFNAREDRVEGETILDPFLFFIESYLGDWHSIATPDEPACDDEDEDQHMAPAASRYVIELITEDQVKQFQWHEPMIHQTVGHLIHFKDQWPHVVTIPLIEDDRPEIPEDFPVGGDLTAFFFAEEIAWIKTNAKGAFSEPFSDDLYEEQTHFGFADKADAALFKTFFGGV